MTTTEALLEDEAPPDFAPASAAAARRVDRGAAIAVLALVAIPVVIFAGADLLGGHLLLTGDNLIQNYPLRALVGSQLRAGTLPSWDPYVWSGTPLLAGLNAGAFFPTTLLFAVLPAHLAWVLGDIAVYSSVGVGTYLLFRAGGTSVLASFLGALTFAFAGAAATQISIHIDMGDGIACLPWALLAVRRIVDDGRWRWAVLLAAALGLSVLAGSPEALLGTVAACVTYGLLRWSVTRGSGRRLLTRSIGAVALAIGGTAFLWMPALRFISTSHRAHITETNASGYSFPPRDALLAFVPYLEGGYHFFSQPAYFGPSNSGEVTLYIGILPLVAALAVAGRRWGGWLPTGERRCWYGVLGVSALLAVASGTPLEHLIYHVPFYGHQRDSGRNIVELDLAACALFAWWVDGGSRPEGARSRSEQVAAWVPLAIVLAAATWFAASPSAMWRALDASVSSSRPEGIAAAIVMALLVTCVGAVVVLLRPRLARRLWLGLVSAFVVVDIALFSAGSAYLSSEGLPNTAHPGPVISLVEKSLTAGGRYAMFDPSQFDPTELANAAEPDTASLEQVPSVTGYESLLDDTYANETMATDRDYLYPQGIASGADEALGLQVLVTVPESFLTPVAALPLPGGGAHVLVVPPGQDPALPGGNVQLPNLPIVARSVGPHAAIATGQIASWWFGTRLDVTRAQVQFAPATAGEVLRLGLVAGDGSVTWSAPEQVAPSGAALAVFPGSPAEGLAVQLLRGASLGQLQASVATPGHAYLVNGALAKAVTPAGWRVVGYADDFVVFRSTFTPEPAWLEPAGTTAPGLPGTGALGTVALVSSSPDSTTIAVRSNGAARLVVSTGYDAGWRASVASSRGTAAVPVERSSLVQSVDVPAGSSVVTLSYRPPDFSGGVLLSAAAAGVFVVWLAAFAITRRRRGRRGRAAVS